QPLSWQVDPAAPPSPSYGNMAAEDATLASAAWPGPGDLGEPVVDPGQDGPTFSDLVDRPGQDDPRLVLLAPPAVPRAGRPRPPTPPWNPLAVFEEAEWIDPAAVDWAVEHNVRLDKAPWYYWLNPDTYELEPGVALHITIKASYSPAEAVKVFLQLVHA